MRSLAQGSKGNEARAAAAASLLALVAAFALSCVMLTGAAWGADLGDAAYLGEHGDFGVDAAGDAVEGEGIDPQTVSCLVFDLEGACDQADAHNLLPMVNEARSRVGASPLTWDSRLEQTAMQRAAELLVSFSHTRPDGSMCMTAFPSSMLTSSAGENIAMGYASSVSVNDGWTNSPGHYANMIDAKFRSMAAACFVANGTKYWVEVFSGTEGDGAHAASGEVWGTFPIRGYFEGLEVVAPSDVIVGRGDAQQLLASVRDEETGEDGGAINPTSFDYESSNTQVVQVDASGVLSGVATGDAVVTLRYAGTSTVAAEVDVCVLPAVFSDVPAGAWYATGEVLGYAVDQRLFVGHDGLFEPDEPITRGQVAVVLHRIAGEPQVSAEPFEDVDYSQYYGSAISWARATGVVNGYADEDGAYRTFGPDDSVTREQLACMLANYARLVGKQPVSSTCARLDAMPDASDVHTWARSAMGWALDEGIMSGSVSDGVSYALPLNVATRCQAAKMVSVLHRDVLG